MTAKQGPKRQCYFIYIYQQKMIMYDMARTENPEAAMAVSYKSHARSEVSLESGSSSTCHERESEDKQRAHVTKTCGCLLQSRGIPLLRIPVSEVKIRGCEHA